MVAGPRHFHRFDSPVSDIRLLGRRIAGPWGRAGTVVLADIERGEMKRIEYTKYEVVTAVAWSPDGKLVAAASVRTNPPDRGLQIDVWSVETGASVQELVGHAAPIGDLAFTPDGKRLLSASADTTLLLWDLGPAREKLAAERNEAERDDWARAADHAKRRRKPGLEWRRPVARPYLLSFDHSVPEPFRHCRNLIESPQARHLAPPRERPL